jgi:hypothetical protein
MDMQIALRGDQTQAVCPDGFCGGRGAEQDDGVAGSRKAATHIAADRSGADDQDSPGLVFSHGSCSVRTRAL